MAVMGVTFSCPLRAGNGLFFTPNHGQWDNRIQYQLEIPGGYMYLENDGVTCFFIDRPHFHDGEPLPAYLKAHAFKVSFTGSNGSSTYVNSEKSSFYYNYLIGNDPSRWKSNVYSYSGVTQKNIYPGVDFHINTQAGEVKSEYHVKAGTDPSVIRLNYKGADKLRLAQGKLYIETSLGQVIEEKPVAWQMVNGEKKMVSCQYMLSGNEIRFSLGKNYNSAYDLVIDPILLFASFIGATADNFGCTATYDNAKNVYAGALVYPSGIYPTTFGAFQTAFNGSNLASRDMGISKFSSNGSALIFSTYLGGTEQEVPHSLVVNNNNELFILGTTNSPDYPVTPGAFDMSFNGGSPVSAANQGINFSTGSDIVVTHLNAAGTAMLGSTYMGGSGNDGLNYAATLNYNYGDILRGEIILDNAGNPIVATTTGSSNFPVTAGAFQTAYGGGTDGCIFKMNPTLSTLSWASYYGGSLDDAVFGVQMDGSGNLFMTGGTLSANLPVTPGVIGPGLNGGIDGFVAKVSPGGNTLMRATYIGTAQYDQSYLIQIDQYNDVYIFGQTLGNYPVTAGVYSNANSGQFMHKMNNSLTATYWSTRIGRGAGVIDISPTAFLVNTCDQIYLCGWGGLVNHYQQAINSTTSGMPVTANAYQSTTDGSDFWLAILSPNAGNLVYGTFFGGPVSYEHVDGGTSRFDKDGVVYQAVCAGCGGHSDFPTTPGAWSNTNNSTNCNLGVFKFSLDNVIADANFQLVSVNCAIPATASFTNLSVNAVTYEWDFGDGGTSTLAQPQHNYAAPGTYTVTLIAADSNTCNGKDTFYLNVFIPVPQTLTVSPNDTICPGTSLPLSASGNNGTTFTWSPSTGLSNPGIGNPVASPAQSTLYSVVGVDTNGCADTQYVYVFVEPEPVADFTYQFTPCSIPTVLGMFNSSSGTSTFMWIFGDGNTASSTDAQHLYFTPGNYDVSLIAVDESGCGNNDTMTVSLFFPPPAVITASGTDSICVGHSSGLSVTGGVSYQWSPAFSIDNPASANPNVHPEITTTYLVTGTDANGCTDTSTVTVYVFPPAYIDAGPDQIFDIGGTPALSATVPGNGTFYWSPAAGLSCTDCPNPIATPETTTTYYLTFTDVYGCTYVDQVTVYVTPSLFIPNAFTSNGDGINDYFQAVARNLAYFEIFIFNRWGELIFQSTDPNQIWDGTHKGQKCEEGVYVWRVKYASQISPYEILQKWGHVTLIR